MKQILHFVFAQANVSFTIRRFFFLPEVQIELGIFVAAAHGNCSNYSSLPQTQRPRLSQPATIWLYERHLLPGKCLTCEGFYWPSRPIRSLRYIVTCTRIRALGFITQNEPCSHDISNYAQWPLYWCIIIINIADYIKLIYRTYWLLGKNETCFDKWLSGFARACDIDFLSHTVPVRWVIY